MTQKKDLVINSPETNMDDVRHEIRTIVEDVERIQQEMAIISATVMSVDKKVLEIWISTMDPDSQLGAHLHGAFGALTVLTNPFVEHMDDPLVTVFVLWGAILGMTLINFVTLILILYFNS
jgi:hypothetical protein